MELADQLLLLAFVLAGFLWLYLGKKKDSGGWVGSKRRLPPTPRGLPVIGNLHQMGGLPHRAMHALSAANGSPDVMLLNLGRIPALVASSPAAAAEILRAQDKVFGTRPYWRTAEIVTFGLQDLAFAPHGEHWRHVRRLVSSQVLSANRSHRQNAMKAREVEALVQAVASQSASSPEAVVDVSGALYRFVNDVVCRLVCGRISEEEEARREKLTKHIEESSELLGTFGVGDYFPALAWVDTLLPGGYARAKKAIKGWDELLEEVMQEHEQRRGARTSGDDDGDDDGKEEDFVDVLLALQEEGGPDGFQISRDTIKALLADMLVAGTETTYITLEWAMSELMKNPTLMKKIQHEVRSAAQPHTPASFPYLKAVVKETLRLHPATPLLVPRECMEDTTVLGYHVSKGTRVFVNAWAIHRDPASWDAPDEFLPERFLESNVDFRGSHFHLIPFGAGRRICPGMTFSMVTVELALANLVRKFDWELPDGMSPAELDMSDRPRLITARRVGLKLVARPFDWEKQE